MFINMSSVFQKKIIFAPPSGGRGVVWGLCAIFADYTKQGIEWQILYSYYRII